MLYIPWSNLRTDFFEEKEGMMGYKMPIMKLEASSKLHKIHNKLIESGKQSSRQLEAQKKTEDSCLKFGAPKLKGI